MEISKNNNILNQDVLEEKKSFKLKIYDYFFNMLTIRREPSYATLYIFHTIEIFQLISFAFSPPHTLTWKISEKSYKYIYYLITGFRLTPLLHFTSFITYSIMFYIFLGLTIVFSIFFLFQILFRKNNSKIYVKFMYITHSLILPLKVVFIIPLIELFLTAFKCDEESGYTQILDWSEYKCWKSTHMFFIVIGVFAAFVLFVYLFINNYYYFYPFFVDVSTTRLTSVIDQELIFVKIIFIIQHIFIKNEYTSLAILLIFSYLIFYSELQEPIYNCQHIEIFLNVRNIMMLWTYFMLLIAKMCKKSDAYNNIIYLLLVGYPLVMFSFIKYYKKKENDNIYGGLITFNNINTCISNIKILMRLINSFIKEHFRNNINYQENLYKKDIIILKGILEIHSNTCLREDCPLTKFILNEGNYTLQKQSLLSHMTSIFNKAMKAFPHDLLIRILFIQFNYDQKYNLNGVKTTFEELRKMKKTNQVEYVIYCQETTIVSMKLISESENDEQEQNEKLFLEQSYQRMKNLISNITKLYAEFWGIFEAKVTNNLNMQKLYKLGEKLNLYLKELNDLWENELKNKKLDFENEPVAQLYAMFIREILWDKKKSDLVIKKINEEHNLHINNKIQKDDNNNINYNLSKLDSLETQDYLIFVKANDKGYCTLLRFSTSLSHILGYERYEILNKPFQILLPSIYQESYVSDIQNFIKTSNSKNRKNEEDNSLKELNKTQDFILIKNKMGYIIPFYIKYSLFEDNDFSDSFLIKMKLENVDTKSMYAFYILTRNDFSVESISSSAIHLGFSMDLLKKYVIKLNVLIRTNSNKNLNLFERYKEFEYNEKKITWVFPDIIYPKNDTMKNNDKNIQDLINESDKAKFYLQITELKSHTNDINGFIFKIFEAKKTRKNKNNNKTTEFLPSLKNQIIFDLLNLKYIRTIIVQKKSGLRNLRENLDDNENDKNLLEISQKAKNIRKKSAKKDLVQESSSDEAAEIKITKEKMLELQAKDSSGIKNFINSLFFYGSEISLIRHRPNREKYPTGKAQEPLIKISINTFTKRIAEKIKENPNLLKKTKSVIKNDDMVEEQNKIIKLDSDKDNNNINLNQESKIAENKNNDIEEINKDLFGDNSLSLKNIVNVNSIMQIKLLDFIIFLIVIIITIIEFIFTNNFYHDQKKRYAYFKYSYDLLNSIVYIKYFVTEGVLSYNIENYYLAKPDKNTYISNIKKELSDYQILFTNIINQFNSPDVELSSEYKNYSTNLKVEMKTWNNNNETIEYQPLPSAQTKLLNSLAHLSNSLPDKNVFDINNKYIYELMYNLLNSHYTTYQKIISLIKDDFGTKSKSLRIKSISIFSVSLVISILFLYIFYKLMLRLDNDREKPVNLFLTIKNKVFEDLKNSSENFSNKLLNKIFGAEENEEEPQLNYNRNIKPNDINITKFLALNDNKMNNNKGNSFIFYYAQLIIFFIIFNIIMLYKYLDNALYYKNIENYIIIYDSIRFSEINIMTRIDLAKQYFEDPSVGNYELTAINNIYVFLFGFISISNKFSETIKEISKTNSFLKTFFKQDFIDNFYHNYAKLLNKENTDIEEYSKYGFKINSLEIFETLRYIYIKYFMDDERDPNNRNISNLINHKKFYYLDLTIKSFFRPWFEKIVELIDSCFYYYVDYENNFYVIAFIFMLILISIFYLIIWKHYEEEFLNKIEMSFDLINLIPEEIKAIIVSKLNETN